ncbi:MAG: ABC transporter ATP-binding protein [Parachlamydiaceae bacterium]|nr:ABC transporter ATP-binding protein [Parachlamydiaceae bacterium]
MREPAIVGRGLKKTYGKNENEVFALKKTDLEVYKHELTLLVGPSGSGKTTLISIIATILTPDEGELILLGQNINNMTENEKSDFRCKNIGIVFQSLYLIPTLTVLENVTLPLIVAGYSEHEANIRAKELLNYVHLEHRSGFSPSTLSKGQQQRIAIIRAMINNSSIIICDEPTSALDHVSGFEIMDFLQNLARQSEKVVLVVTHDSRIFSYADRVITMADGEIIQESREVESLKN